MEPTLLIGDYLFASKFSYGFSRYSPPFSPPLFSGRVLAAFPVASALARFTFALSLEWPKRRMSRPLDPGCRCRR